MTLPSPRCRAQWIISRPTMSCDTTASTLSLPRHTRDRRPDSLEVNKRTRKCPSAWALVRADELEQLQVGGIPQLRDDVHVALHEVGQAAQRERDPQLPRVRLVGCLAAVVGEDDDGAGGGGGDELE